MKYKTLNNKIIKFFFNIKIYAVYIFFVLCIIILFSSIQNYSIQAAYKNYSIDNLDIKIDINKDSSVNISETLTYTFNDEMNGMFREITLTDDKALKICQSDPNAQCGGFDLINIDSVFVNEKEIPDDRYKIINIDKNNESRLRVEYKFDNAPVKIYNKTYTFQVNYTVLGSIAFFNENQLNQLYDNTDQYALFYWDAIFPDRDKNIENAQITINYPGIVNLNNQFSKIKSQSDYEILQQSNNNQSKIIYKVETIKPREDFTIIQKINPNDIDQVAILELELWPEGQNLEFDKFKFQNLKSNETIYGFPTGQKNLQFSYNFMYEPKEFNINLEPNQTYQLKVDLEYSQIGKIIVIIIIIINLIFLFFTILFPVFIFIIWRKKGKDLGIKNTIVPEYKPPDNIRPYLLGSLKDEKVDTVDITSTIIDLAFRGYIKIIEKEKSTIFSKKYDFELQKLKSFDDLNPTEQKIINAIFEKSSKNKNDQEVIQLNDLKNNFYKHISGISNTIYNEMVKNGYFLKNPDNTRKKWLIGGFVFLMIFSIIGFFSLTISIFTILTFGIVGGICLIIASFFMPAKTIKGGQTFMKVKGFKMYMQTAEKYRVQNLTPEIFEKFLAYAIVFGIEKSWAQKFKDIYKNPPDWYESSRGSSFNTLLLANSLSTFNSTASSTITSKPSSSSGSSFGSGWSGGGGFSGGFSGGGGGGGGGGAW